MTVDWANAGLIVFSALTLYLVLAFISRVVGLRTFSTFDGFDFVVTIAVGSLIASTLVSRDPPIFQGLLALGALYTIRLMVSVLRYHAPFVRNLMSNRPLLLVYQGHPLEENLAEARMSRDELLEKVRDANVLRMDQVEAMVLETTGEVSVLQSRGQGETLDPTLLENVRGFEQARRRIAGRPAPT